MNLAGYEVGHADCSVGACIPARRPVIVAVGLNQRSATVADRESLALPAGQFASERAGPAGNPSR
jgi:hypothetical protein